MVNVTGMVCGPLPACAPPDTVTVPEYLPGANPPGFTAIENGVPVMPVAGTVIQFPPAVVAAESVRGIWPVVEPAATAVLVAVTVCAEGAAPPNW